MYKPSYRIIISNAIRIIRMLSRMHVFINCNDDTHIIISANMNINNNGININSNSMIHRMFNSSRPRPRVSHADFGGAELVQAKPRRGSASRSSARSSAPSTGRSSAR